MYSLSATNYQVCEDLGIGNIINASNHFGNKHTDEGVKYLNVNVDDYPSENIVEHFDRTYKYIEEAPGPVLVHCAAGVSRSSSIVIAYLMKKYQMNLESALTLTYSRRRVIHPNEGFLEQLVKYETELGLDNKTTVSTDFISSIG